MQVGRQHSERVPYATCPVCARASRPRSLEVSATECIARHISEKARQGDEKHRAVHRALHISSHVIGCPGCDRRFATRKEMFEHLELADDAAHAACKMPREELVARRQRSAEGAMPSEHFSAAGTAGSAAVAAAAAHLDPAVHEIAERRERTAGPSLYGAAKMGHVDAVAKHLADGANPNEVGPPAHHAHTASRRRHRRRHRRHLHRRRHPAPPTLLPRLARTASACS